ncbi:MAG: acetylxylan esterase, partial [Isosphaeraceae bacterium]|nr:acetylxylan esterase [Isosphaeraceae bacterium]
MSARRTIRTASALLWLLGFISLETARADEPQPIARVFSASDFPRLARGIRLPRTGEYTLKVWSRPSDSWSIAEADDEGLKLAHAPREPEGASEMPRWQMLGQARIVADRPFVITISSDERDREKPKKDEDAKADAGKEKKEASQPEAEPVPALLTLSTDPDQDFAPVLDLIRGRLDTTDPPADPRRTKVRTNQEGADFRTPDTPQAWRDRARALREQVLVSLGLRPMFPKTDLRPRVYGRLERNGYTIEKVVLETFPGFVLCGNLYRPTGRSGRLPAVLCPHGHWPEGRFTPDVQMRCIRWAKLGCVVFLYDMVGYGDTKPFGHSFRSDRLRRWGLSLTTLQTWNSIRALDWLTSLPDVDATRIGCTGESGGGTQTFLLSAIDDRVTVAAPVVMVSDSFQGGCECENPPGLRLGTDNVEITALI